MPLTNSAECDILGVEGASGPPRPDSSAASSFGTLTPPPEICVLGDAFDDVFVEVTAKAKNYEGIATTHVVKDQFVRGGGASIVFRGLKCLGHDPIDGLGWINEQKVRYFVDGKLVLRVDGVDNSWVSYTSNWWPAKHAVIVDYGKGSVTPEVLAAVNAPVVFVHAKRDPGPYWGFKPIFFTNSREWPVNSKYDGLVVQTLGERGVRLLAGGKEIAREKSRCVAQPHTVVGAGDYVMAGFVDAMVRGSSYTEALAWSQVVVAEAMKDPYACRIGEGVLDWRWYHAGKKSSD